MNKPEKNKFSGEECAFCKETKLNVGEASEYGAAILYKIGGKKDGWFANLSPKTGGNPETDFSIQIVPFEHLRNFGQINDNKKLAENYGIIFGKVSAAVAEIIKKEGNDKNKIPIGTYGKCKHEDEHMHIKIFPYRNEVGQPFTSDSSYQKKEKFRDEKGEEYVKMIPVVKKEIAKKRFNQLKEELVKLLK